MLKRGSQYYEGDMGWGDRGMRLLRPAGIDPGMGEGLPWMGRREVFERIRLGQLGPGRSCRFQDFPSRVSVFSRKWKVRSSPEGVGEGGALFYLLRARNQAKHFI